MAQDEEDNGDGDIGEKSHEEREKEEKEVKQGNGEEDEEISDEESDEPVSPPLKRTYTFRRKVREPRDAVSKREMKLRELMEKVPNLCEVVIFTGSGISASSGMSTFTTRGGLYERARKRCKVKDGQTLFTDRFFRKNRLDALAFFAEIHKEATKASPTSTHKAIMQLAKYFRLRRNYTMNVDGLHRDTGLTTWRHSIGHDSETLHNRRQSGEDFSGANGMVVEMHGNIREVVCEECGHVSIVDAAVLKKFSASKVVHCSKCEAKGKDGVLRFRMLLYDDSQQDLVVDDFIELGQLDDDLSGADAILWMGISFEQSASTELFKEVSRSLKECGRQDILQVLVNPDADSYWNISTAVNNLEDLNFMVLHEKSDVVLEKWIATLRGKPSRLSR